jgi:DNA-binding CsgD family transcriptional regulator
VADIVLSPREQRALRALLSAEPSPGGPLPTRQVLEQIDVLVPSDSIEAVYQDGDYTLTQGIFLGLAQDDARELPEQHDGPFYLGPVHWGRNPVAAAACGFPDTLSDGLLMGFRNGADAVVQIGMDRRSTSFTDRDVAMFTMLAPALARLVRERPTPTLPVTLTVQERRVLSHVAAGRSNQEIAQDLFVAPSTVRKHLEHSYRKLGVTNRVAAVARLQGRDTPDLDLRDRLERLDRHG